MKYPPISAVGVARHAAALGMVGEEDLRDTPTTRPAPTASRIDPITVGVAGPDAVDPVAVADVGGEAPAHVRVDDEVLELGRQPVMPGHRSAVEMVGDAAPQRRLTDRVDGRGSGPRTASATSECSVTPDAKRLAEGPRRQPLVALVRIGVAEHVLEQFRRGDPRQGGHAEDPVVGRDRPRHRAAGRRGRRSIRSGPVSAPTTSANGEPWLRARPARRRRRRPARRGRAASRAASAAARPSSSIVCTSASQPCSNQAPRSAADARRTPPRSCRAARGSPCRGGGCRAS